MLVFLWIWIFLCLKGKKEIIGDISKKCLFRWKICWYLIDLLLFMLIKITIKGWNIMQECIYLIIFRKKYLCILLGVRNIFRSSIFSPLKKCIFKMLNSFGKINLHIVGVLSNRPKKCLNFWEIYGKNIRSTLRTVLGWNLFRINVWL